MAASRRLAGVRRVSFCGRLSVRGLLPTMPRQPTSGAGEWSKFENVGERRSRLSGNR